MTEKGTNAIEIRGLHKSYFRKPVLTGMDMTVPEGSIYAFLGRNSEGKTTTMKLILKILLPNSGTIKVFDHDAVKDPVGAKLEIGYIPESPIYYEWMKVEEILNFIRTCYGERWDREKEKSLVKNLNIPLKAGFGSLSMGAKIKVAMAAALSHNPRLLLLDDPTAGLDAVVRREFLETLVDIVDTNRCSVLFATHIINEVERIADHVGILKNGSLLKEMPLEDLKDSVKALELTFPDEEKAKEHYNNNYVNLPTQLSESIKSDKTKTIVRCYSSTLKGRRIETIIGDLTPDAIKEYKASSEFETAIKDLSLEDIFVHMTKDSFGGMQ